MAKKDLDKLATQTAEVTQAADGAREPKIAPAPTPGRIVHYWLKNGQIRPAMVVYAYGSETVDLQVFTSGDVDRAAFPERVITVNVNTGADHHAVPSMVFRPSVTMGDEPGQWTWPVKG